MTEARVETDGVNRSGPVVEWGAELDARAAGELERDLPGLGTAFDGTL